MASGNPLRDKKIQQERAAKIWAAEQAKKKAYTEAIGIRTEISTVSKAPAPRVEAERIKNRIEALRKSGHASTELIDALRNDLHEQLTKSAQD